MFRIEISKKYKSYDDKIVKVLMDRTIPNRLLVLDLNTDEKILEFEKPEELKKSFDFIPEKRGYIKKDDKGNLYLTIIRFVDYHIHSDKSLLDGANKIDNIVSKSEGCSAITDHGVTFGVLDFYKKMGTSLKKSIIGCEIYVESIDGTKDANHMVLLVKNDIGWHNLCYLLSKAETNFYNKPQVSYDSLQEFHEGLICTTACLGGEVPQKIMHNRMEEAEEVVEVLKGIFEEDFYIEIQHHNIPEETEVNKGLYELANAYDIKLLPAIDSHYTNKEDAEAHEILLCIGTKKILSDPTHYKFTGTGYHLHSADEFEELFKDEPELIINSFELADKCMFNFNLSEKSMPKFQIPEGYTSDAEYFEHQARVGFEERFKELEPNKFNSQEYKDRLDYEIKLIINTGFPGYFLIVQDYILWAKENNIYVGPGRGSCVGSLVSYSMKITDVDPIPLGLIFERFINPERISPPDIDIDFEDDRREEVIDYLREKYGTDNVSRIVTFGTLAAKQVVKDVGKVLGFDTILINNLAKAIPAEPKMTIAKAFKVSPDFKDLVETNAQAKKIIKIAETLEGLSRHKSQHACGVVVSNKPVRDTVPEILLASKEDKNTKVRTAAFNMSELEELGLLKMDFLGLRNMTIERLALDTINKDLN